MMGSKSNNFIMIILLIIVMTLFCHHLFDSVCEGAIPIDMVTKFFESSSSSSSSAAKTFDGYDEEPDGTQWAVLVAGSKGFENYRHQADVCHAYQLLKRKGVKPENIIVFMYDDIAYHELNPYKGVILNALDDYNVYEGVPKDYTGDLVNSETLKKVLLPEVYSDYSQGSGKVLNSYEDDYVFIYFSGHGGKEFLDMPEEGDYLTAETFMSDLALIYPNYRRMLIYVEACHAGSMFLGKGVAHELPLNIYAMTASNPYESSFAWHCNITGELSDLTEMTVRDQYRFLRQATLEEPYSSHVMEYGFMDIKDDDISLYMGSQNLYDPTYVKNITSYLPPTSSIQGIEQSEVEIYVLKWEIESAAEGSAKRLDAEKRLKELISHRLHVDRSGKAIISELMAQVKALFLLHQDMNVHRRWDSACIKAMDNAYEASCGPLGLYGMKAYREDLARLCKARIEPGQMALVAAKYCA